MIRESEPAFALKGNWRILLTLTTGRPRPANLLELEEIMQDFSPLWGTRDEGVQKILLNSGVKQRDIAVERVYYPTRLALDSLGLQGVGITEAWGHQEIIGVSPRSVSHITFSEDLLAVQAEDYMRQIDYGATPEQLRHES